MEYCNLYLNMQMLPILMDMMARTPIYETLQGSISPLARMSSKTIFYQEQYQNGILCVDVSTMYGGR